MADDLWNFSLRFYADADVQRACLALQDAHGADVNIALCLLWHATRGAIIGDDDVAALDAAVRPWREATVVPLRARRRALKETVLFPDGEAQEAFRTRLKKVELEAERLEQHILSAATVAASARAGPETAGRANLAAYARFLRSDFTPGIVDTLAARLLAIA
ncbi:TIGR02444 family protein [Roseitranquillus sediminis]|uniref:TIGR02444 family protein n=1 Tax=Roseitranquillus sediminis TaxID=2809051 RepID=UPI001D0C2FDE|nr:TIGR02444 family protein [Roseitranquillus sediminis]MBM9593174.1 TIGR02444 family protein [Roseitranquillus sediminis]